MTVFPTLITWLYRLYDLYISISRSELRHLSIFCAISRMWNAKTFNPTQPTGRKCAETMAWTMALASSPSTNGAICSTVWWGSYCSSVGSDSSSLLQKVMFICISHFFSWSENIYAVEPVVIVSIQFSNLNLPWSEKFQGKHRVQIILSRSQEISNLSLVLPLFVFFFLFFFSCKIG